MSSLDHIRVVTSDPGPKQYLWRNEPDVKDWDTFVTWIKASEGHDWKYDRPYVAGTYTWSEQGDRKGVHLVERHVITLDADAAGHDYLERLAEVADWKRLSHTTASHMKDGKGPRWRTLIPLSRAASPSEYLTLSLYLREQIGAERLDKSASTSPAAVAYAPAWDGVAYDEVDGPVLDVDGLLLVVELLEWHPTTSVPDATVAEFLHEHPSEGQPCAYGRVALDRVADELEDFPADDGAGFHQKIGNAGMRFVEMVLAGCWSADDVDRLREAANHRADPRPKEFDEAIAYGLGKGCVAATNCDAHGGPAAADVFDAIDDEPGDSATNNRMVSGGSFVLDQPDEIPWVWGEGNHGVWAEGEAFTLAGPAGVGKTTLAGQAVKARLVGGTVLRMPVEPTSSKVLYLAMDRPRQIARSLRRTLGDVPREVLDERLVVWPGPPMQDVAEHPETLLKLAREAGADTIVIDSIKDAAVGLSDDKVGSGYNRARQICLANGVEVLELHHMVKKGENGAEPTSLAHVYGSAWITAGAGSVALLWGQPGDPVVQWKHLKQPAEEVGPFKVQHDHTAGVSVISDEVDLKALVRAEGKEGMTARGAAVFIFEKAKPTAAEIEKARRRLEALVRTGVAERIEGTSTEPTRWVSAFEEEPS